MNHQSNYYDYRVCLTVIASNPELAEKWLNEFLGESGDMAMIRKYNYTVCINEAVYKVLFSCINSTNVRANYNDEPLYRDANAVMVLVSDTDLSNPNELKNIVTHCRSRISENVILYHVPLFEGVIPEIYNNILLGALNGGLEKILPELIKRKQSAENEARERRVVPCNNRKPIKLTYVNSPGVEWLNVAVRLLNLLGLISLICLVFILFKIIFKIICYILSE